MCGMCFIWFGRIDKGLSLSKKSKLLSVSVGPLLASRLLVCENPPVDLWSDLCSYGCTVETVAVDIISDMRTSHYSEFTPIVYCTTPCYRI